MTMVNLVMALMMIDCQDCGNGDDHVAMRLGDHVQAPPGAAVPLVMALVAEKMPPAAAHRRSTQPMDGPQIRLSAAHRRSTQPIHGWQMLPRLLPEKSLHHDDDKQSVHDNTHMMMVMRMTIFRLMNAVYAIKTMICNDYDDIDISAAAMNDDDDDDDEMKILQLRRDF